MSAADSPVNLAAPVLAALLALYIALTVREISGLTPAIITFILSSWLFYRLTSIEKIWNTLAMLIDPAKAAILVSVTAVVYFAVNGFQTTELILTGAGFVFIGAALGMLIYSYSNIGG